jgi:chorismate mutase/prephenate dehydratase
VIELNDRLKELRTTIDELDKGIAKLLARRVETAKEIGRAKGDGPIYDPAREEQIIRRFSEMNPDLDRESLSTIHKEIISLCRSVQGRPTVACMGPEGSYSQQAMERALGSSIDPLFVSGPREVFRAVETGRASLGLVPVENTVEGTVYATLDGFSETGPEMTVIQEVSLPIRHVLASASPLSEIKRVVSHPQALAQCRLWLEEKLPGAKKEPVATTSHGAAIASSEPGTAAVCSAKAAEVNRIEILSRDIQDRSHNRTRFWVVGPKGSTRSEGEKTSILFSVPHRPGSLLGALDPLRTAGVNLTAIQSRPMQGNPFEYLFFLDMMGNSSDPEISDALEAMRKSCLSMRVLGSYPSDIVVPGK